MFFLEKEWNASVVIINAFAFIHCARKGRGGGLSNNFISMGIVFPICRIIIFETMSILFPPQNILFLIKKYPCTPHYMTHVCVCAVCVCVCALHFPRGCIKIFMTCLRFTESERDQSIDCLFQRTRRMQMCL